MGNGGWILDLFLVLVLGTVAVAIGFGLYAKLRSRANGGVSTAWASAALVISRVALVSTILVLIPGLIPGHFTRGLGDETITNHSGTLTVRAEAQDSSVLCPMRTLQDIDGPHQYQMDCRASRAVAHAKPPNATVAGYQLDVAVAHPTRGESRRFGEIWNLQIFAFLMIIVSVERMLTMTARRRPFAIQNVRWLRVLALMVVVNGLAVTVQTQNLAKHLIATYAAPGSSTPLVPSGVGSAVQVTAFIAILILVLAEIWRFGIRLQEDVEATV